MLHAVYADVTAQIAALQARQEQIAALLAAGSLDAVDNTTERPSTLQMVGEQFPDHAARPSQDLLEQDARIFALFDGFHWPDGHREEIGRLLQYLTARPALYHRLLTLAARLAALASVPPDDLRVDQLIADWSDVLIAEPAVATFFARAPIHDATALRILQATALAALSPAQQRVVAEVTRRHAHLSDLDAHGKDGA